MIAAQTRPKRKGQRTWARNQKHRRGIAKRRAAGDAQHLWRGHRVRGQALQNRSRSGQQRPCRQCRHNRCGTQRQEGGAQLRRDQAPAIGSTAAEQGQDGQGQKAKRKESKNAPRMAGTPGNGVSGLGPGRDLRCHAG
jgi:hypothetical protein